MDYTHISFALKDIEQQELLAALLADLMYEGFEFTDSSLEAFIPTNLFRQERLDNLLQTIPIFESTSYTTTIIPETNWNELWEKGYAPMYVKDELYIRATFHQPDNKVKYEVVIDPKMSFGTGHHDTTRMMAEMLLENSPNGKTVMDFGSGTGILSIIAAKMGATSILAIDHEEWAYNNCVENIQLNDVKSITPIQGDASAIPSITFDIVLANVNKNVILDCLALLVQATVKHGFVYLSGLLTTDEEVIVTEAKKHGLTLVEQKTGNNWICLKMAKA